MKSGDKNNKSFYGWIALGATALLAFVALGGVTYSFGVFQPSLCKEFGWGVRDVSLAFALAMFCMGLASPLTGFLIGKYGPRKTLIFGNFMGVLGLIILAFHRQLWQLYVGYGIFIGIGVSALGGMIGQTTIANNWFRKKVSLAIGIIIAAGGAGGIVLVPTIAALIERYGWRHTYLILSGLALVLAVIIPGLFIRNKPEDLGQVPDGIVASSSNVVDAPPTAAQYVTPVDFTVKEAMRTSAFWLIVISVTMIFFILTMLAAHQVTFLLGMGVSAGMAGFALGLIPGTSAFANILMGFVTFKFSLKKLSVLSTALMLAGMIILMFTKSLPMALAYSLIFACGYGASVVAGMSLTSSYFGRKDYPKIMGFMMIFSIFGNVGAPVAGAIFDATKSYSMAFSLAVAAAAIGFVCMVLVKPPVHPSLISNSLNNDAK